MYKQSKIRCLYVVLVAVKVQYRLLGIDCNQIRTRAPKWPWRWISADIQLGSVLFVESLIILFFDQVASRELHIPPTKIYISETSTSTVPNTCPSAASFGTDANGMAVKVKSASLLAHSAVLVFILNINVHICLLSECLWDSLPEAGANQAEEPQRNMGELGMIMIWKESLTLVCKGIW